MTCLGISHRRYRVRLSDFVDNHGKGLVESYYANSPLDLLRANFPDYSFLPWLFPNVSKHYFDKLENRKLYIEWLFKKEGLKDLAQLRGTHFHRNHGSGFLRKYGGSPSKVIESLQSIEGGIGDSQSISTPLNYWVLYLSLPLNFPELQSL